MSKANGVVSRRAIMRLVKKLATVCWGDASGHASWESKYATAAALEHEISRRLAALEAKAK